MTKPWNRPRPKLKRYKKPDPACEERAETKRARRRERNRKVVLAGGFVANCPCTKYRRAVPHAG